MFATICWVAGGIAAVAFVAGYAVWYRSQNRDATGRPTTRGNLGDALKTGAAVLAALIALAGFIAGGKAAAKALETSLSNVTTSQMGR
ncbi:hypothetical protein ABZ612_20440 [Streptomyces avermitilis]|uniref:hypothetical protein n=1 Tax=Streptomyces avermitilis TaxID=33903 RepID=UPI0033EE7A89